MVAYTHYRTDPRCRREAEALAARGDAVDFVCLGDSSDAPVEIIQGVTVRRIKLRRYRGGSPANYLKSYAAFFLKAFGMVTRRTLRSRYDIIHVHSLPDQMVFVALIAKLLGTRVILDMHDLAPELYADRFGIAASSPFVRLLRLGERLSVGWSDRIVCVHDPQARHLAARCRLGRPPCIVMNAPDPRLFKEGRTGVTRAEERDPSHTYKIVHHGTLVQRYGADVAVRAFAEVKAAMPEARFFIYGNGDFRPALEAEISGLRLGDSVYMSDGALPLDEMPSAISGASLGIVPHRDGPIMKWALPTKMMEYMAMGIPVVVARTEVIAEYFDDSMVMFFEPGNVSDLARCLLKLYREPELGRTLAHNAARFLEEHSWDREKLKLFALVDDLAS